MTYQEIQMKEDNSFTGLEGKIVEATPIGRPFLVVVEDEHYKTSSFDDTLNKNYFLPKGANAFVRDNHAFLYDNRAYIAVQAYKIKRRTKRK